MRNLEKAPDDAQVSDVRITPKGITSQAGAAEVAGLKQTRAVALRNSSEEFVSSPKGGTF
jgi:propanediol dehydratase small subunit